MKVLLAGATGAIGGPLLAALSAHGHQVHAIIRNPADVERITDAGAIPVVADVMDSEALLRAVDGLADAVMHQATALRGAPRTLRASDPTLALRAAHRRRGAGHPTCGATGPRGGGGRGVRAGCVGARSLGVVGGVSRPGR